VEDRGETFSLHFLDEVERFFFLSQEFAASRQRDRGEVPGVPEEMGSRAEVQHQLPEAPPPSSPESTGGCGFDVKGSQWAAYACRLRGSPTPSSSSRSSATTADTFLLEDVSDLFPFLLL
jgi:hypothetical protein